MYNYSVAVLLLDIGLFSSLFGEHTNTQTNTDRHKHKKTTLTKQTRDWCITTHLTKVGWIHNQKKQNKLTSVRQKAIEQIRKISRKHCSKNTGGDAVA